MYLIHGATNLSTIKQSVLVYHIKQLKNHLKTSKSEALIYDLPFVYCIILLIPDQSAFNSNIIKLSLGPKLMGEWALGLSSVQFPHREHLKPNPRKNLKLGKP